MGGWPPGLGLQSGELVPRDVNLASTRLILSRGHEGTDAAGHVIQAFGNFVMSRNFITGIIVSWSSPRAPAASPRWRRASKTRRRATPHWPQVVNEKVDAGIVIQIEEPIA
jgi:hypothetical protein